jgi:hypothetical protein
MTQDFKNFIELLNDHRVRYMIIDGYALAFYGYPRNTGDMDFWIEPSKENIQNLLDALKSFGFSSLGLKIIDFMDNDNVIQLGFPPNRIDLISKIPELDFEVAYNKAKKETYQDQDAFFIDVESLILIKKGFVRKQNLADIERLEEILREKDK